MKTYAFLIIFLCFAMTLLAQVPGPVINPSPNDDLTDVAINPTLSWSNALTGATPTGYRVYLGTNDPPSNILNGVDTTETNYITPFLQGGTQYFWKVVAYNENGDADSTSIWNFTTLEGSAVFDITPGDHDFGRSVINYAKIQNYTMRNTGNLPLVVNSIGLSDTTGFTIYSALWLPALLSPGDSLQFEVWFTPWVVDESYSTNLLINETSQLAVHSYLLQGRGTVAGPIITANINGAGTTNYGETIQTLSMLTIYNTGNYELLFSTGPLTAPWITMNPASGFVQTNESLDIELIFDSNGMTTQNDPYEGILSIITNDSVFPTFDLDMQMFVRNIDTFPFFVPFNELSFPPNGWTTQILSGVAGFEGTLTGSAPPCVSPSETRMISFTGSSGSIGDEAYLASPPIEAADSLYAYSIEFNMYRDFGIPGAQDRIEVYSNSTQDLDGTPVLLGTINRLPSLAPVESGGTGWYYYSLNFTPNTTGISYVIFKAICDGGNDIYLDDMIIWKQEFPPPVYSIHPDSFDFGRRPVNHTATLNYAIYNTGGLPLTVNSIGLVDTTNFILSNVPALPMLLNAGDSLNFELSFTPTIIDEYYETSLLVDESSQPLHVYHICGSGTVVGPVIASSLESMYTSLVTETTFAQPITIYNNGIGDLSYSAGTPSAPWLTLVPSSAVIAEGHSLETTLLIDTHGMNPGNYEDVLIINTNDTVFPVFSFSVQMDVNSRTLNPYFHGSPLIGHAPLLVEFTDASNVGDLLPGTTITEWHWDFQNDGIIDSNEQNPSYTYTQPGVFSVKLEIVNNLGMSASRIRADYVEATNQAPIQSVTIDPVTMTEDEPYGPINLNTYFSDPDSDPITFAAINSTHISVTISGDSYSLTSAYGWAGTETIQLVATDPFDYSTYVSVEVTVVPGNDPPVFHLPETVYFLTTTTYTINFADYITDDDTPLAEISISYIYNVAPSPHIFLSYTPNVPGALTGTFTSSTGFTGFEEFYISVTDNAARDSTATQFRMHVLNEPVVQAGMSTNLGYTGQTVNFTDNTLGNPDQWLWNFGDGITSTSKNPTHTYLTPNTYNVQLTIRNTTFSTASYATTPVTVQMVGILAQPNVTTPQSWQIAGGQNQYNVFENVNVAAGSSLTIGNGVTVNVFNNMTVDVNGVLNSSNATFRPIDSNTWNGLRFRESAQTSHLENCTIKNATNPVIIDGGNVALSNLTIKVTGQIWEIDDTAVQILGSSSPSLSNVNISNYTKGIFIQGSDSAPTLTDISVSNVQLARDEIVRTALEITGEINPVINRMEIKNCDYGIKISNPESQISAAPFLHGIEIYNEPGNYDTGKIGLDINGNVCANIDSLYIDRYDTGLIYQDYAATNSTPTLTNIRVRNSTNASRGTGLIGVLLADIGAISFTDSDVDSMAAGIIITNNSARTTSTPTLTNIRVRNSTNASRSDSKGVEITGDVSPQFSNIQIDNYSSGLYFNGTGAVQTTTPTLTNIRVRNSTNASRTSSKGIVIINVNSFIATNDTIDGFSEGLDVSTDLNRTVSTPTLTNIRVRNSTNASRNENTGIFLGSTVLGAMNNCLIEGYLTGVFLADGNQTVLRNNLIKNCATGLKASGFNPPMSIERNIFKLETDWQNEHQWTYIPVSVQYAGFWNIYHNTIWGYPLALEAANANLAFKNNIVWDDSDIPVPFSLTNCSLQSGYNDIRGYDTGSINSDPLLVDPTQDDFHLTYDSPCIDAGDPGFPHDSDSTFADIGAYNYLHKAEFSPHHDSILVGEIVDFQNLSVGHDYQGITTVQWDLGNNGSIESTDWDWSPEFTQAGVFDLKLIVTTGNLVDTLLIINAITVTPDQLDAPQNPTLVHDGDNMVIFWDADAQRRDSRALFADYYIIYTNDSGTGAFTYLNHTSWGETFYTDINGALFEKRFYLVIGFSGTLPELLDFINDHSSYPFDRSQIRRKLPYRVRK